jgi:hypothetical protein
MSPTYDTLPDHDERMRVAERVAGWYLGDRGWAGMLVGAYLNHEEAAKNLGREMEARGVAP